MQIYIKFIEVGMRNKKHVIDFHKSTQHSTRICLKTLNIPPMALSSHKL